MNNIANAAARKMQNFVQVVTSANFKDFNERSDKTKVLYFTDKKTTSATLKALSKKYLDKLSFGEVRSSDAELIAQFKIEKYPTMIVVADQTEVYEGEMKVDQI